MYVFGCVSVYNMHTFLNALFSLLPLSAAAATAAAVRAAATVDVDNVVILTVCFRFISCRYETFASFSSSYVHKQVRYGQSHFYFGRCISRFVFFFPLLFCSSSSFSRTLFHPSLANLYFHNRSLRDEM